MSERKPYKLLQPYKWVWTVGDFMEVRSLEEALNEVREVCGEVPEGTLVIKVWDPQGEDWFYLPLVPKREK